MTPRVQHLPPQHWHIQSVRVRVREGPERLRQAYRLLLQPVQPQEPATPATASHEPCPREGAQ